MKASKVIMGDNLVELASCEASASLKARLREFPL